MQHLSGEMLPSRFHVVTTGYMSLSSATIVQGVTLTPAHSKARPMFASLIQNGSPQLLVHPAVYGARSIAILPLSHCGM